MKTKSHNREDSTLAFFLARAHVCSKLKHMYGRSCGTNQRVVGEVWYCTGRCRQPQGTLWKIKKKKIKWSHHQHHTRSHTWSRSRSKSTRRSSHSLWRRKSQRDSPSRSRSAYPSSQRGTHGQPDDQRSSPSGVGTSFRCGETAQSGSNAVSTDRERTLQPPRIWHEVPIDDTLDYNEVITWGDSDKEAGDRPTTTNLATVSEKTESYSRKYAQRGL